MNSRERVLSALSHRQPDRVPVCLSGHRSSGIAAIAYPKLRAFLGLPARPVRVYDPVQQLAIVDADVLDRFGVDTIEMGRGFSLTAGDWRDWVLPDGTPCKIPAYIHPVKMGNDWHVYTADGTLIAIQRAGCLYFEQTCFPLLDSEAQSFPDLATPLNKVDWWALGSPPAPIGYDDEGLKKLAIGAKALRQSSDRAIIGLFGGNLLEIGQFLFRADEFFLLLAADPPRADAFLDALVEIHLANLEQFLRSVGPYIDVIVFGDDLGMQTGPQISPAMYRRYFKERHAKLWRRAKELAKVKVMLHCCGGVRQLLPDLIDAGLDAINPVQIAANGMDLRSLRREFGSRITFWGGGCDTQFVLPEADPEQVARHVADQLRAGGTGGGFVFQQVHNIMANVPPANVIAMLDSVRDFRG